MAFGEAGFREGGDVRFALPYILFTALPLADQLGCQQLLALGGVLPGAKGAVALVSGRLQHLPDAIEFGLQSLQVVARRLERAPHLVSFVRQPASFFPNRILDALTLRLELARPPALSVELLRAHLGRGYVFRRAVTLIDELLLDARPFGGRLLLPLPLQSGSLLLEPCTLRGHLFFEPRAFGGCVFFEASAIFGGLLLDARQHASVLVRPGTQILFRAGALAGELLFGARPFGCQLLLGPRALLGQRAFELLAHGRRALGRCLFGFNPQPGRFGDHPVLGIGADGRDLRFEPGGPLAPDFFDTSRPALLRIRLGGTAGALDLVGMTCGELRQLSFELLVQPATYRVDCRTKRIFSHFWHYRGG